MITKVVACREEVLPNRRTPKMPCNLNDIKWSNLDYFINGLQGWLRLMDECIVSKNSLGIGFCLDEMMDEIFFKSNPPLAHQGEFIKVLTPPLERIHENYTKIGDHEAWMIVICEASKVSELLVYIEYYDGKIEKILKKIEEKEKTID